MLIILGFCCYSGGIGSYIIEEWDNLNKKQRVFMIFIGGPFIWIGAIFLFCVVNIMIGVDLILKKLE